MAFQVRAFTTSASPTTARNVASVERFGEHVVDDRLKTMGAFALIGVPGHQQNRDLRKVARHCERKRDAVHDRHADVGQQEVETTLLAGHHVQRLAPITCCLDLVSVGLEASRTQSTQGFFVFGYQVPCHESPAGSQ